MDHHFDAGKIYWQEHVAIREGMSVLDLRTRLMAKVSEGFGTFLNSYLSGDRTVRKNLDWEASYAPKRTPEDSRLSEWYDRDLIYRKIMALRSEGYPAFFVVQNQKVVVLDAKKLAIEASAETLSKTPKKAATIETVYSNGIKIICLDGRKIDVFGFQPSTFQLRPNQAIL